MIIKSSEFFKSAVLKRDYPKDALPEVAFAGKSNVGKSSLINAILNRKRLAKTSSTPGRTQLINYFIINNSFFFVDLPGYGFAKVSKQKKKSWGKMAETYLMDNKNLRCVVLILDIRRLIQEDDYLLIDFLYSLNIEVVFVLTKIDKVSKNEIFKQKVKLKKSLGDFYEEDRFILFSALTKKGKTEVLKKLGYYLSGNVNQSS
jgi:GTP-binding protein